MRKIVMGSTLALAALGFIPVELPLLVAPANAIVGRPVSPVSVAGVARRTTRRTVAVAATAKPATVVVATPAPAIGTCVTKYDAYGQKITTCTNP